MHGAARGGTSVVRDGMPRRPALALASVLAASALAACGGPVPDREPDVTGVAAADGDALVLAEPSDRYYEGMRLPTQGTAVVGPGGGPTTLAAGDAVEVWVAGPCAESFPVQCEVGAVRLVEQPG